MAIEGSEQALLGREQTDRFSLRRDNAVAEARIAELETLLSRTQ